MLGYLSIPAANLHHLRSPPWLTSFRILRITDCLGVGMNEIPAVVYRRHAHVHVRL